MDDRRISAYCNIAELTYIESGQHQGQTGHWFSDRKYQRKFVTEDDIFHRLERRKQSLFARAAESTGPSP